MNERIFAPKWAHKIIYTGLPTRVRMRAALGPLHLSRKPKPGHFIHRIMGLRKKRNALLDRLRESGIPMFRDWLGEDGTVLGHLDVALVHGE